MSQLEAERARYFISHAGIAVLQMVRIRDIGMPQPLQIPGRDPAELMTTLSSGIVSLMVNSAVVCGSSVSSASAYSFNTSCEKWF